VICGREDVPSKELSIRSFLAVVLFRICGGGRREKSPNAGGEDGATVTSAWKEHSRSSENRKRETQRPPSLSESEEGRGGAEAEFQN